MANSLVDGNSSWAGGMDTSRPPDQIAEYQYSTSVNLMVPDSLSGLQHRPGYLCCKLNFRNDTEKLLYSKGQIQGGEYFIANGQFYLVAVCNGIIFRFSQIGHNEFNCVGININSPNDTFYAQSWVTKVPNGAIVQNGINTPYFVGPLTSRRTKPAQGEINIGMAGTYCQFRYWYVDQSGKLLIPSDYGNPVGQTESSIFGNIGFAAPDSDEEIVAVTRQKTLLNYVEGGNLLFSTNQDIYSVDVRGPRSTWNDPSVPLGKVSETIPGYSAVSSNSFESFNSNIYFRDVKRGISSLRQSEFQFTQQDSGTDQAIEANLYLQNDTDWMLNFCYSKTYNHRLLTTIAPEINEEGHIYWNGLLSFYPSAVLHEQKRVPQRYESVWTGVRPWVVNVVHQDNKRDILFVHSYDDDGVNRLYMMDGSLNHDVNHHGQRIEIRSTLETRGYNFKQGLINKKVNQRVLKTHPIERTYSLTAFARPEVNGPWTEFFNFTHKICRIDGSKSFEPVNSHPVSKTIVMADERFGECYAGLSSNYIQYRFEFVGPIKINWFAIEAAPEAIDLTVTQSNDPCDISVYNYRPDFKYLISDTNANIAYIASSGSE